ncbi:MAG: hypothetical protein JSU77_02470 [Fidelibacterota bacterium]|nr:MAG: hypothetical protein JSU77_02470 [Candidatus Neomarinimicrobiota bacterium]
MEFCTAINCMDGRVQLPVISYLEQRFNARYVDVISEPGSNLILAEQTDPNLVESILQRLAISVNHHHSQGIAIVGHHDCAGNTAGKAEQISHLRAAIAVLSEHYPEIEMIGLWVDENWQVNEV